MNYYDEESILYLNGSYLKATEAKTDLFSQSLHYGYAVYEGLRAYKTVTGETKVFKAMEHFERLKRSAELIGIPYPYDNEKLVQATYSVLTRNRFTNSYIRPLVFCPPNMTLQKAKESSIMIAAWEWGAYLGDKLLRVMTSSFQRPNPMAFKITSKACGHYVNSIIACQEAKDKGYDEALLLDGNGFVAEGPGANVFFEKDEKLFTPPPGNIVLGITRATVMEICARMNIPVEEKFFTPDELRNADAAFFCGTAAEIVGWDSLDGSPFKKKWSESISKAIQDAYKLRVIENELCVIL